MSPMSVSHHYAPNPGFGNATILPRDEKYEQLKTEGERRDYLRQLLEKHSQRPHFSVDELENAFSSDKLHGNKRVFHDEESDGIITPPPTERGSEEDVKKRRPQEQSARQYLEQQGCPAIYPSTLQYPVRQEDIPDEHKEGALYFRDYGECSSLLRRQQYDWQDFLQWLRRKCPGRSLSKIERWKLYANYHRSKVEEEGKHIAELKRELAEDDLEEPIRGTVNFHVQMRSLSLQREQHAVNWIETVGRIMFGASYDLALESGEALSDHHSGKQLPAPSPPPPPASQAENDDGTAAAETSTGTGRKRSQVQNDVKETASPQDISATGRKRSRMQVEGAEDVAATQAPATIGRKRRRSQVDEDAEKATALLPETSTTGRKRSRPQAEDADEDAAGAAAVAGAAAQAPATAMPKRKRRRSGSSSGELAVRESTRRLTRSSRRHGDELWELSEHGASRIQTTVGFRRRDREKRKALK